MLDISCDAFETFVASLPSISGRYLQTRRTVRPWRLRVFPLGDVTAMLVRGGAINLFHGSALDDQLSLYLPLSDPQAVALGGETIGHGRAGWLAPGQDYLLRTDAPTRWLGLHFRIGVVRHRLDLDDPALARWLAATRVIDLPAPLLDDVVDFVLRLHAVTAADPAALASARARAQAAQQLLDATLRALETLPASRPRATRQRRRALVMRCMELVEQQLPEAPTVDDLCAVAGVSDRTLRGLFVEQTGMGPHRYLMTRRMQAIHQALDRAQPDDTVTAICTRYGVWDLGRFARQYRQLYGLLPSQHLATATRAQ